MIKRIAWHCMGKSDNAKFERGRLDRVSQDLLNRYGGLPGTRALRAIKGAYRAFDDAYEQAKQLQKVYYGKCEGCQREEGDECEIAMSMWVQGQRVEFLPRGYCPWCSWDKSTSLYNAYPFVPVERVLELFAPSAQIVLQGRLEEV